MSTVALWTGYEARALRIALRMSVRQFAAHLGVAQRTVSNWESLLASTRPTQVMQEALDTALRRSSAEARGRFEALARRQEVDGTHELRDGLVDPLPVGSDSAAGNGNGLRSFFSTDLEAVVRTTRCLWTEDLREGGLRESPVLPAGSLLGPIAQWLVAPTEASPERVGGMRVGLRDVEAIRSTVRVFERLDHDHGGGRVRLASVQYLRSTVLTLLEGSYRDATGRDLYAAATEATYKTGAMAYDVGLHDLARRYFLQALSLAQISNDRALGGKVLALMSHQANFLGEYSDAVDLARAASMGGHRVATPRIQAMYAAMAARALASLDDPRGCHRALLEMEQWFDRAEAHHDPAWIGYFTRAEFYNELAHCFAVLGDPAKASEHAELALAEAGGEYPRSQTFCKLAVAIAYLSPRTSADRDIEQACTLARSCLPKVAELESRRVRTYLDVFTARLESNASAAAVATFKRHYDQLLPPEQPT